MVGSPFWRDAGIGNGIGLEPKVTLLVPACAGSSPAPSWSYGTLQPRPLADCSFYGLSLAQALLIESTSVFANRSMEAVMNSEQQTIASLIRQLTEKRETLLRGVQQIDGALENIQAAARMLDEGALPVMDAATTASPPSPVLLRGELRGKTQLAALIHLAKKNGGLLKIVDGKDALMASGLMKKTKNAYNITYNTAIRSGRFAKESPGVVRLIEDSQQQISLAS